jgi:bifunctional DNase/RNase
LIRKSPIVVLRERDGETLLPVWVGAVEAMAVSLALNNEALPRPLTHDLMLLSFRALKAKLLRVEISDLREGVFYAMLLLEGREGRVRVDCRPSDAIALAVRAQAPIMVAEEVLRRAAAWEEHKKSPRAEMPVPDAATDMLRQAGAQKEADLLGGRLLREGSLPPEEEADEERFRELLRSLEPTSRRKM